MKHHWRRQTCGQTVSPTQTSACCYVSSCFSVERQKNRRQNNLSSRLLLDFSSALDHITQSSSADWVWIVAMEILTFKLATAETQPEIWLKVLEQTLVSGPWAEVENEPSSSAEMMFIHQDWNQFIKNSMNCRFDGSSCDIWNCVLVTDRPVLIKNHISSASPLIYSVPWGSSCSLPLVTSFMLMTLSCVSMKLESLDVDCGNKPGLREAASGRLFHYLCVSESLSLQHQQPTHWLMLFQLAQRGPWWFEHKQASSATLL